MPWAKALFGGGGDVGAGGRAALTAHEHRCDATSEGDERRAKDVNQYAVQNYAGACGVTTVVTLRVVRRRHPQRETAGDSIVNSSCMMCVCVILYNMTANFRYGMVISAALCCV